MDTENKNLMYLCGWVICFVWPNFSDKLWIESILTILMGHILPFRTIHLYYFIRLNEVYATETYWEKVSEWSRYDLRTKIKKLIFTALT